MARRPSGSPEVRELYQQLLLFPERAEYLEQTRFDGYRVHLEHWRDLSIEFRHRTAPLTTLRPRASPSWRSSAPSS
ncbi:MAG TPA: hypothetical protein VK034_16800, partial [Enhygromyxa sp.]|nr:hypothetical protein [Enhygromyxa sp.]